jgi:hypothetical protein
MDLKRHAEAKLDIGRLIDWLAGKAERSHIIFYGDGLECDSIKYCNILVNSLATLLLLRAALVARKLLN